MRRMRANHSIALAFSATLYIGSAYAAEGYAEAKLQGEEDAKNPDYRVWYLQKARPAFSGAFGPALNECAGKAPPDSLSGFGVVLVIGQSGEVVRLYWKSTNPLAACLAPILSRTQFPAPPKHQFFFGLEAQLGSST